MRALPEISIAAGATGRRRQRTQRIESYVVIAIVTWKDVRRRAAGTKRMRTSIGLCVHCRVLPILLSARPHERT